MKSIEQTVVNFGCETKTYFLENLITQQYFFKKWGYKIPSQLQCHGPMNGHALLNWFQKNTIPLFEEIYPHHPSKISIDFGFNSSVVKKYFDGEENIFSIESTSRKKIENNFQQSLEFIEKYATPYFEMVRSKISHLYCFDKNDLISASSFKGLGIVVCSPKKDWGLPHYMEVLIHESAHIQLLQKNILYPFLLNKNDVAFSPLRKEIRPLLGILHALTVMIKVQDCFQRIVNALPSDHYLNKGLFNIINEYQVLNYESLKILKQKAKWTTCGEIYFSQCESFFTQINSEKPAKVAIL